MISGLREIAFLAILGFCENDVFKVFPYKISIFRQKFTFLKISYESHLGVIWTFWNVFEHFKNHLKLPWRLNRRIKFFS